MVLPELSLLLGCPGSDSGLTAFFTEVGEVPPLQPQRPGLDKSSLQFRFDLTGELAAVRSLVVCVLGYYDRCVLIPQTGVLEGNPGLRLPRLGLRSLYRGLLILVGLFCALLPGCAAAGDSGEEYDQHKPREERPGCSRLLRAPDLCRAFLRTQRYLPISYSENRGPKRIRPKKDRDPAHDIPKHSNWRQEQVRCRKLPMTG